jgi:hypothetical protein
MSFVETLNSWLSTRGVYPPPEFLQVMSDLADRQLAGLAVGTHHSYWHQSGFAEGWEDAAQSPYLFQSLERAKLQAESLSWETGHQWRVFIWVHPEAHFAPLEKYTDLLTQLPGCPRQ